MNFSEAFPPEIDRGQWSLNAGGGNKTSTRRRAGWNQSYRACTGRGKKMNGKNAARPGRGGQGRRNEQEVQSNDSGSLINFARSKPPRRVIHHAAFDPPFLRFFVTFLSTFFPSSFFFDVLPSSCPSIAPRFLRGANRLPAIPRESNRLFPTRFFILSLFVFLRHFCDTVLDRNAFFLLEKEILF